MTEKALPNTSEGLFSCAAEGSGPEKNPAAPRAAGYASVSGRGREDSLTAAEIAAFMLRPAGPVGRGVPGSFRGAGPSDRLRLLGTRRLFGPSLSLLRRARRVRKTGNNPLKNPPTAFRHCSAYHDGGCGQKSAAASSATMSTARA